MCQCFSVITVNVMTVCVCMCVCVCYCLFAHAQRTVLKIVSEPLHVNFMKLYHTGRYCNEDTHVSKVCFNLLASPFIDNLIARDPRQWSAACWPITLLQRLCNCKQVTFREPDWYRSWSFRVDRPPCPHCRI
jgi:hypothetical protein